MEALSFIPDERAFLSRRAAAHLALAARVAARDALEREQRPGLAARVRRAHRVDLAEAAAADGAHELKLAKP